MTTGILFQTTRTSSVEGTNVRCTCCGMRKKLAELSEEGLTIINGRSGNMHKAFTSPLEILETLSGTYGTGIVNWALNLIREDHVS